MTIPSAFRSDPQRRWTPLENAAGAAVTDGDDDRIAILRPLERGEIDVAEATRRLDRSIDDGSGSRRRRDATR